jgi:uncharacterized membrane protein
MYEVGSYFGPVLVICFFSAVLMIQVVCDTTPYWLVIVFNFISFFISFISIHRSILVHALWI